MGTNLRAMNADDKWIVDSATGQVVGVQTAGQAKMLAVADAYPVGGKVDPVTGKIRTLTASGSPAILTNASPNMARGGKDRPVCMAIGNSFVQRCQPAPVSTVIQTYHYATLDWAMAFMGQPFKWARTGASQQIGSSGNSTLAYGRYGFGGGYTLGASNGWYQYFSQLLATGNPDVIFFITMENDVLDIVQNGTSVATYLAAYQSIINQCLNSGILPVWVGCSPSTSYNSTAYASAFWSLTHGVESIAAVTPGMIYVPVADLWMDGSSSYPVPLTSGNFANVTDGATHPIQGSVYLGKRIADVMAMHGYGYNYQMPGPGDTRFVGGNTYVSGSGTGASAPWTATTTAANLSATSAMTNVSTLACTLNQMSGNARQVCQVDVATSGAQAASPNFIYQMYSAPLSSNFVVGDYVQGFYEVTLDSAVAAAGLRVPNLSLTFTGSTDTYNQALSFQHASAGTFAMPRIAGAKMLIATPEVKVPVGTTAMRIYAQELFQASAASVTARLQIGGIGVVNWGQ